MDLLLTKIVVSALTVLGLALVAEHASPRWAGILSAFPLGAAIVLYFIGIENGPAFAADAAVYATAGMAASLCLVMGYHLALQLSGPGLLLGPLGGVAGFALGVSLLKPLPLNLPLAVLAPALTALLFARRFAGIADARRTRHAGLRPLAHLGRALFTAAMVVLITGIAERVGSDWAGLLAAFPVSMFPFLILMHFSYGPAHAHTICKNFNLGIGALVSYMASATLAYPAVGVNAGTAIALLVATGYLLGFAWWRRRAG